MTTLLIVSALIDLITFRQGQQFVLTSKLLSDTVMVVIGSIEAFPTTFTSTESQRTVWKFRTQIVVNVGSC